MLIRASGYNDGAKEYLEEGQKAGRSLSRDELDERVILYGDLDLTEMIYQSIPNNGQDRYLTFTMSFREDEISSDMLFDIADEFRQFMMYAYRSDEYNFYAEAHIPKIKTIEDKRTGELVDRKPHIHVIIPRKNLLSGKEANPIGVYEYNVKYFEAFQEYINQKYELSSPREHVRIDPQNAASVLSRYKGDDFYGKNREFKQSLVKQIINEGVATRAEFYQLVAGHGETRIRNEGKPNEYVAVKLAGDAKFTNLKETIFQDDFIVHRKLAKPPLESHLIQQRLTAWPKRAKELKYVYKEGQTFREQYKAASPEEQILILQKAEQNFYNEYGEPYDLKLHAPEWQTDPERSPAQTGAGRAESPADRVQDLPGGALATDREARDSGQAERSELLPSDAYVRLGQSDEGGDPGLRPAVRTGGGRRSETGEGEGVPGRSTTVPSGEGEPFGSSSTPTASTGGTSGGGRHGTAGRAKRRSRRTVVPPHARNPNRVATVGDIEARAEQLFREPNEPTDPLSIRLKGRPDQQAPPVPVGQTGRTGRTGRKSTPGTRAKGRYSRNVPPYARNPHRVATIGDIQARAERLFRESPEYGDPLQIRLKGQTDQQAPPKPADQAGVTNRTRRKSTSNKNLTSRYNRSIPPYAKNPHRVSTLADVEARSRRLFELNHDPELDPIKVRQIKHKLIDVNRSASTVASYFVRQADENKLLPAQRRAVAQVDKQYFDLRRFIFNDTRLSRHDKAQLVSVLTFERLKAREAIKKTLSPNWSNYMSSAAIRNLMAEKDDRKAPEYSITGANPDPQTPIRDRVQRLVRNLTLATDSDLDEEQKRELSAKDIYTRRSKITQAVHYLDKTTDKTLFIDTGKAIALRKNGITEAGVTVALQLAQQRFGSTLTVNGSAEFKRLCVETVAKGEMDIHFTDKKMNQALAERRAELALEKEGQQISSPDSEAEISGPVADVNADQGEAETSTEVDDPSLIRGTLDAHGQAPYQNNPKNSKSYFVTISTDRGPRTLWGSELERVMSEGQFTLGQKIKLKDHGPEPITIRVKGADGLTQEKEVYRRVWSAESELVADQRSKDAANPAAAQEPVRDPVLQNEPKAVQPAPAPPPLQFVHEGKPVTLTLPDRTGLVAVAPEADESLLVAIHKERMATMSGVELSDLMTSDAVAYDFADYDAAQVVAGNDSSAAGRAHVLEMMKYENYREFFRTSAFEYAQSAPPQFKVDAVVGQVEAEDLYYLAVHGQRDADAARLEDMKVSMASGVNLEPVDPNNATPDYLSHYAQGLQFAIDDGNATKERMAEVLKVAQSWMEDYGKDHPLDLSRFSEAEIHSVVEAATTMANSSPVEVDYYANEAGWQSVVAENLVAAGEVFGWTQFQAHMTDGSVQQVTKDEQGQWKRDDGVYIVQPGQAADQVSAPVVSPTDTVVVQAAAASSTDTASATHRIASVLKVIADWSAKGPEAGRVEKSAEVIKEYQVALDALMYEVGTKAEPIDWGRIAKEVYLNTALSVAAISEYARGLQFALDDPYATGDSVTRAFDAADAFVISGYGKDHPLDLMRFRESDTDMSIESLEVVGTVSPEPDADDGPRMA